MEEFMLLHSLMKTNASHVTVLRAALLAVLIICFQFSVAMATPFTFSYQFATGDYVSGSVEGTLNAEGRIDNLSNISININGIAMTGPIYQYHADSTGHWAFGGAYMSVNALENNFGFSNSSNLAPPDSRADYSWYFFMPLGSGGFTADAEVLDFAQPGSIGQPSNPNFLHTSDTPVIINNWSIPSAPQTTFPREAQPVPESDSTLTFLIFAVAGLALTARKLSYFPQPSRRARQR